MPSLAKYVEKYSTGAEKNRKRDVNQYYRGRDNRDRNVDAPPGRGDIPIMHGDCDGK